ncbi:MAG: hypothetical protein IPJ65_13390 [Archangiaceae bacterium]|nr:hypothetical protein [Archangiaceae bacterium]
MRFLAAVLVMVSGSALAGSVYLNGVRIDGVTNQKFDKVNVAIDDQGNVLIEAPGYNVRQVEGAPGESTPRPQPAGTLTKKYFLVTEQATPGMTEFDVEVFVNSKYLRTLKSGDEQIVTDITGKLTPGRNVLLFRATKRVAGATRKSFSKDHFFRVIIGEGQMSGDHVMIDNPVVRFERTAAENSDVTQEFTLTTR